MIKQRSGVAGLIKTALFLPVAILFCGCIPIPHPTYMLSDAVPDQSLKTLKPGVTTRQDVVLALGPPHRTDANGRFFFYTWSGSCLITIGWPFGVGDATTERWFLCLEFESDGRLIRWERIKHAAFIPSEDAVLKAWMAKTAPAATAKGGHP
jgi:outer membrane protein assembly factor BamE (lipoprotein component of BamABCDE complex)